MVALKILGICIGILFLFEFGAWVWFSVQDAASAARNWAGRGE